MDASALLLSPPEQPDLPLSLQQGLPCLIAVNTEWFEPVCFIVPCCFPAAGESIEHSWHSSERKQAYI